MTQEMNQTQSQESPTSPDVAIDLSKPPVETPVSHSSDSTTPDVQYDLQVNGVDPSLVNLEEIVKFAQENKLSPEVAQKLVDNSVSSLKANQEGETARLEKLQVEWTSELQADKQYGGDNYKTTMERAQRVLHTFFEKELIEQMGSAKVLSNPRLVRSLNKIFEKTMDDNAWSKLSGTPVTAPQNALDILYPTHKGQ